MMFESLGSRGYCRDKRCSGSERASTELGVNRPEEVPPIVDSIDNSELICGDVGVVHARQSITRCHRAVAARSPDGLNGAGYARLMSKQSRANSAGHSSGQRVIVMTGASSGIGEVTADRLHRAGWIVIGASRRGTSSGGWKPLVMDVDNDASVAQGVSSVLAEYGRIDAAVACAGWGLAGAVEATPIADAKAQLETNFWGATRLVQSVLPTMRAQGAGRLVLMSSIGGVLGIPFQAYYSASKFAMEGYGESLAYEVAPFGIGVTLVQPGNVRTDFTASRKQVGMPHAGTDDDAYSAAAAKAIGVMEHDELNGVSPDAVAKVVERMLNARRPPRRVSVGKVDERVGIVGKRLLPYRLYERAARSSLGV